MKITIAYLYPDILNLCGDNGNIATLKSRIEKRGIEAEIKEYKTSEKIDFENTDIIYIGAGGEKDAKFVCETLMQWKDDISQYVQNGGCILGICSGYYMLGNSYDTESETVPGLEILNIYTKYSKNRAIGDVILKSDIISSTIVGFENHYGKTYINDLTPLGTVAHGNGNNDEDNNEGVVFKNVIGTNLHGPLLPKNPLLADYIIEKAIEYRYKEKINLEPMDDTLENMAHDYIIERYK